MSTNAMAKSRDRIDLLQGTLDMLILRTLRLGAAHGHDIARHIQRTTDDVLQVEHGSLYPALHRLEQQGFIKAEWQKGESGRDTKVYSITRAGRQQLEQELDQWERLSAAIRLTL